MEHVRKIKRYGVALATLLLAATLPAADLTRGVTFTDGQRVTAAGLHSLVDATSVGVAFLTGKSLLSAVDSADYVLVYDTSTGTFKKMTLATLLTGNTELITAQPDEPNPAGNDYLLLYDASGGTFAKVSVTNLITGNTNLVVGQPAITNLLSTAELLVNNGGTNNRISLANLWASNFQYARAFTNQAEHTSPTNVDRLLIWDAAAATNKWTTLAGLVTNTPSVVTVSNGAVLQVLEANVFKQITVSNLMEQFAASGTFLTTNVAWTTNGVALTAGVMVNAAHGLGVVPSQLEWKLVMGSTTELGYSAGDEVDLKNATQTANNAMFGIGASATNVWLLLDDTTAININDKSTGNRANITAARWTAKGVIRP